MISGSINEVFKALKELKSTHYAVVRVRHFATVSVQYVTQLILIHIVRNSGMYKEVSACFTIACLTNGHDSL